MKTIQLYSLTTIITCFICLTLSIPPVFSTQKDAIGKVIAIRGAAIAISGKSESRSLSLKAPVFLKDTIKTQNGRIQMMFKDNTLVTLGRNSQIQITKYLWEPGNSDSAMETRVPEGSFRIMGGAITRIAPNNFKTDSPSGTIGIRGSMYAGMVKDSSLFVIFQGGKGIYVQNKAGIVDITRPGFGTRVGNRDMPPEEPHKIDPKELQEFESLLTQAPVQEEVKPSESSPDSPESDAQTNDTPQESDNIVAEPASQEETPAISESQPFEALSDTTSLISDTTLDSNQKTLDSALTPVGTEQEIQFLLIGLGVTDVTLSTTAPSSGIWKYKGEMKNTLISEDNQTMKFVVNGNNNRIIGFEENSSGPASPGFAFGEINSAGEIFNVKVLGSGGDPNGGEIMALTGSETFGHFYGASHGGLGLAMEGFDYNVRDQTLPPVPWSDLIAGKLESPTPGTPSTGSAVPWNGFFIGVSEDMTSPNTNRRVFYNTSDTNFSLSINKDAGTFSGSLNSVSDFNGSGQTISISSIGGGAGSSAYITDQILGAEITGSDVSPLATGQKDYGNYLVSANEPMLSSYTTWGYWEVAYDETGSPGGDYHLHVPGALWIAGEKTSTTPINNLIATSFSGVYNGKAKGIKIDPSNQMSELTNGTTSLNIKFASSASPSISGTISFTGIKDSFTGTTTNTPTILTVTRTANISTPEFTATIAGSTATGNVHGTFFGPNAEAVGGNFAAEMTSDGTKYHGIFAGNR